MNWMAKKRSPQTLSQMCRKHRAVDPWRRLQHVGGEVQMCLFKRRKIYSTVCRGYGGRHIQTEHKHVQYEVVPDRAVFIPGCLALWAQGGGSVGASEGRQVTGFRKYQVFGTKVCRYADMTCVLFMWFQFLTMHFILKMAVIFIFFPLKGHGTTDATACDNLQL